MFSRYKFYLLENLENEISLYDSYIHQRYEDENIDASRPLINPNDSFVDKDILKSFCSKDKIIKEVKDKKSSKKLSKEVEDKDTGEINVIPGAQYSNKFVILGQPTISLGKI